MSRINAASVWSTCLHNETDIGCSDPLFGSNTLHLVPVEHLRNLVATHPAAVGLAGSNHVWDPFLPVFLVNRQASVSASSLSLRKGMCTSLVCALWFVYIEFYDCKFCLRDQRAVMGGAQTLCHHLLLSDLSSRRWS